MTHTIDPRLANGVPDVAYSQKILPIDFSFHSVRVNHALKETFVGDRFNVIQTSFRRSEFESCKFALKLFLKRTQINEKRLTHFKK